MIQTGVTNLTRTPDAAVVFKKHHRSICSVRKTNVGLSFGDLNRKLGIPGKKLPARRHSSVRLSRDAVQ